MMVKRTRVLIIPDVDSCIGNTTYYCMADKTVCRYCDVALRRNNVELCIPCTELYKRKIIFRDCGSYHKTTKSQRVQSMSDEAKRLLDESEMFSFT